MIITAIKQQVKHQDRYSLFVDGKYTCSLSEGALIAGGWASGKEVDARELNDLKRTSELDKAYGNALRYVAIRPRSEWELHDYFRRKSIDEAVAEEIGKRLQSLGLLSDLEFARSWVANRRVLKNTSKRRLYMELKQKHVPDDIIATVLGEDEADERDQLRALAEKKRPRYPDDQKFMQYLARQGFGFDDIKSVLAELREAQNDGMV